METTKLFDDERRGAEMRHLEVCFLIQTSDCRTSKLCVEIQPLCTGAESNLESGVLGELEKKSIIALPGKQGHRRCSSKTAKRSPIWGDLAEVYIATSWA